MCKHYRFSKLQMEKSTYAHEIFGIFYQVYFCLFSDQICIDFIAQDHFSASHREYCTLELYHQHKVINYTTIWNKTLNAVIAVLKNAFQNSLKIKLRSLLRGKTKLTTNSASQRVSNVLLHLFLMECSFHFGLYNPKSRINSNINEIS